MLGRSPGNYTRLCLVPSIASLGFDGFENASDHVCVPASDIVHRLWRVPHWAVLPYGCFGQGTRPPGKYNVGMRNAILITLAVLATAAILAGTWLVVQTVQETARPVVDLSAGVSTQIAAILHPTPTIVPDPVTIVREVRSLARLETIQYTVEKVITAESRQGPLGFLFGDRLLFIAHGVVIAGVDLGQLKPADVWLDAEGRAYLRLPEAEIFVATLDNKKSYVYDRETGLLTQGDISLEAAARQAAEDEIRQAALDDGILGQARLNAESTLYRLLRALEIPDIIFVTEDSIAPVPALTVTP